MRVMTWNCRVGGYRTKCGQIARYRPDLLIVQEVEPIEEVLIFPGEHQPTFRARSTDPSTTRGVGVFSYTNTDVQPVDAADLMAFKRYCARLGSHEFQVVSVWTAATKIHRSSYRQAHEGLRQHGDWIRQRPTIILGDFNHNASYNAEAWHALMRLIEPLGLVSAYHRHFAETFGSESLPTHFHLGKEAAAFHIDYCFVPSEWGEKITSVEVGKFEDWHKLSDHAPLIVDIDI